MTTHRDDFATCPICKSALDPEPDNRKLKCGQCGGALVAEAEVSHVIGEIVRDAPAELALEPPIDVEPFRTCPRCTNQMTKHALYGIQIDRCVEHGIWFDGDELQRVYHEVGLTVREKMPLAQKIALGATSTALIGFQIIRLLFFL